MPAPHHRYAASLSGRIPYGVLPYLAYFNELAGGPRNGYRSLVDSNLDWGQDLRNLKRWLREREIEEPINLCYFGMADPRFYQIRHVKMPGGYELEPPFGRKNSFSQAPSCRRSSPFAGTRGRTGGSITMFHTDAEAALRDLLEIPDEVSILCSIPLGKPAGSHGPLRRLPVRDLVYDDGWGSEARWATDPPGSRFSRPR